MPRFPGKPTPRLPRFRKHARHVKHVEILLVLWLAAAGAFAGHWWRAQTHVTKAKWYISNTASLAEIQRNFTGQPLASGSLSDAVSQLSAAGGFSCAAWSNGDKTTGHGWIVLRCSR